MPRLRPIRSEAAYERALSRISDLMGAKRGTDRAQELDILADLVELYERKHFSLGHLDPVDAIKLRMEEQGLAPRDLVPFIGSAARVSQVLDRKRPLTLPMARALHRHLGVRAEVLLRAPDLPEEWDDDHWRRFPIRTMANRGWIPKVPRLDGPCQGGNGAVHGARRSLARKRRDVPADGSSRQRQGRLLRAPSMVLAGDGDREGAPAHD